MLSQFATVGFAVFFGLVVAFQGLPARAQMTIRGSEGKKGDSLGESVTVPTQRITRKSTNGQTNTTIVESVSGSGLNTQTATDVSVTAVPQDNSFNWLPMVMTIGIPLIGPMLGGGLFGGGKDDKKDEDDSVVGSQQDNSAAKEAIINGSDTPAAAADAQASTTQSDSSSSSENKSAYTDEAASGGVGQPANDNASSSAVDDTNSDMAVDRNGEPDPGSSMMACGKVPGNVMKALKETLTYRDQCSAVKQGYPNGKVVVNDYSFQNGVGMMYIFNHAGTQCMYKTPASYGNGFTKQHALDPNKGTTEKGFACASDSSNATPPGMHITKKTTSSFPNALAMVGLEDQGSYGRTIRIHGAQSPGYGASHGCTGVADIKTVNKLLGEGSIVYNYFGDAAAPQGCSCAGSGFGSHNGAACKIESAANNCDPSKKPQGGSSAGGSSSQGTP